MKELLKEIVIMEEEMEIAQQKAESLIEDDEEKSKIYESEADEIYERLYKLMDQAADKIVSITSGRVDKITAMKMLRCRRNEVERLFV